jgi:hypothetical protein
MDDMHGEVTNRTRLLRGDDSSEEPRLRLPADLVDDVAAEVEEEAEREDTSENVLTARVPRVDFSSWRERVRLDADLTRFPS